MEIFKVKSIATRFVRFAHDLNKQNKKMSQKEALRIGGFT